MTKDEALQRILADLDTIQVMLQRTMSVPHINIDGATSAVWEELLGMAAQCLDIVSRSAFEQYQDLPATVGAVGDTA